MNLKNNKERQPEPQHHSDSAADNSQVSPLAQNRLLSAALSVEEGNKLIAEFMGLIYNPMASTGRYDRFWINDKSKGGKKIGAGFKELKYHSSWDWLMPVVEKIERLLPNGFTQIYGEIGAKIDDAPDWEIYSFEIELNDDKGRRFYAKSSNSKIESVWLGVVEFIKWYNDNAVSVGSI